MDHGASASWYDGRLARVDAEHSKSSSARWNSGNGSMSAHTAAWHSPARSRARRQLMSRRRRGRPLFATERLTSYASTSLRRTETGLIHSFRLLPLHVGAQADEAGVVRLLTGIRPTVAPAFFGTAREQGRGYGEHADDGSGSVARSCAPGVHAPDRARLVRSARTRVQEALLSLLPDAQVRSLVKRRVLAQADILFRPHAARTYSSSPSTSSSSLSSEHPFAPTSPR